MGSQQAIKKFKDLFLDEYLISSFDTESGTGTTGFNLKKY
jgi:hypothetical protein